ncbi:MAG: hypothetical protein N2035_01250 [Chthoniobacterales bacterium]|nr:hypothetical protein [Chthoniobacterales bacterium]
MNPALLLILSLLLIAPTISSAATKKRPPFPLSVHAVAPPSLPPPFSIRYPAPTPSGFITLEKIPIFDERHIIALHPIPAADGSFGAYFKLNSHASRSWEAVSSSNQTQSVVVLFNNRLLTTLKIDRPIRDGILYVPGGISPTEIQLLLRYFPPLIQNNKQIYLN